ncbi:MAG TPA: HD domain-containing protein [Pyrinomonadaceae bacterium]|nr:HD domain-containing protein [Pyrinomonadaceae bacterium]
MDTQGPGKTDFDEKLLELSSEIDAFEGYSYSHGLRIASIADAIGKYFSLAAHDRFFMQQAALLHDIGEMVMNREYIKQDRPLSAAERLDLQRHPVIGEKEVAKRGYSRGVQLLVRWHHEWWNGCGYPDALEGDQIPLAARILRVADSYAALRDDRPRRKAMTVDEAKAHLGEWAGLEFDPRVVRAFLASDYLDHFEVEKTSRKGQLIGLRPLNVDNRPLEQNEALTATDEQPLAASRPERFMFDEQPSGGSYKNE